MCQINHSVLHLAPESTEFLFCYFHSVVGIYWLKGKCISVLTWCTVLSRKKMKIQKNVLKTKPVNGCPAIEEFDIAVHGALWSAVATTHRTTLTEIVIAVEIFPILINALIFFSWKVKVVACGCSCDEVTRLGSNKLWSTTQFYQLLLHG